MENKSHLSKLVEKLDRIKAASDGANSSMPDDPSGDGTTEPRTGSQFTQYAKDKDRIETVPPDADRQPSASMSDDHEQENSLSSYTLSTAGSSAQSAKGEYTDRPTDPGTSMPAEAGQEKYSSASNCTLEENIDMFNKCAESLLYTASAYDQQVKQAAADVQYASQLPLGTFTKLAEDLGASPDEANEIAALEAIVEEQPELLDQLADMSPEELEELQAIADVIDNEAAGAAAEGEGDMSPEEALELEKDSFYQLDPTTQRVLTSFDEGHLKQAAMNIDTLLTKIAEGDISEEELAAILEEAANEGGEENPTEEELGPEEVAALADAGEAEEKEGCGGGKCRKKASYPMSAADLYKSASPEQLYYLALQKQAEDEAEAYNSLSPEEQALLNSASDEELQEAISDSDAATDDPTALEAILGDDAGEAAAPAEGEGEPSSDEALNELAAAMDEQGITPEALEAASKEGSADPDLYKMAKAVIDYRNTGKYVYGAPRTQKAAELRSISHKYLSEIFPHK